MNLENGKALPFMKTRLSLSGVKPGKEIIILPTKKPKSKQIDNKPVNYTNHRLVNEILNFRS